MSGRVLVVEDDPVARRLLVESLERAGFSCTGTSGTDEALRAAAAEPPQVVVTDIRLAGADGLELLRALRERLPRVQVITVTAFGSLDTAVRAIREGAFDHISKPFPLDEMERMVRRAMDAYESGAGPAVVDEPGAPELVGRSRAMTEVFTSIARVADLEISVLIRGETGTGKELVARAIHDASRRSAGPYVAINCAALPEGLLESELFGYEKGAFTGATRSSRGLFAAASGGTVFLDEIGDMPPSVQAKLLRVLEAGEVRPVGSADAWRVDVRVVAATHRDLEKAVADGAFREDLLYRLNTVTIELPPLRERAGDLPLLVDHFLRRHAAASGRSVPAVTPEAMALLERYPWPGNVRELSHVVARVLALTKSPRIDAEDLPPHLREAPPAAPAQPATLDEVEKAHILAVLRSTRGNRKRTSAILGIDRKTLYRKLLRYGLEDELT
jgi:DNA-binding NtrC family response regulator